MSKAIFEQAYKFATRIMEIVQSANDFHIRNYDNLQKTGGGFYGSKASLYRYSGLEIEGGLVLRRRNNENSHYMEYLCTSKMGLLPVNGIYSNRLGDKLYIQGGLENTFYFDDGKSFTLTDEFKEDNDFQLGLLLDNYELKAYYSAGILAGMGYKGRVKIDDTIVFTNMLKCMKEEMYEYERLGFFRRRH